MAATIRSDLPTRKTGRRAGGLVQPCLAGFKLFDLLHNLREPSGTGLREGYAVLAMYGVTRI
jgi:hypothetical protein